MKSKHLIILSLCFLADLYLPNNTKIIEETKQEKQQEPIVQEIAKQELYYGKTKQELIDQINKSLTSDLSNKGEVIVNYSLEYGVDPYLATAIILHETGCRWGCSTLVKKCNNVAGQVAKPNCNGTSYKKYDTLDEGIKGAIYNIYINYVKYGLLTAEQMNSKYAEDPKWATKVNKYINEIKQK